jgi:dihydrofolate reductase
LYQALLPRADYLYLTEIHQAFEADTLFPDFDRQAWQELERIDINDDASVDFCYSFLKLEQIQAASLK